MVGAIPYIHVGGLHHESSQLEFATALLDPSSEIDLDELLQPELDATTGLVFIIVESWQPWLETAFQRTLPHLPYSLTETLSSNSGAASGSAILPVFDNDDLGLGFVMDNIDIFPSTAETSISTVTVKLGNHVEARLQPIVAWTRLKGGLQSEPERPIVVLISEPSSGTLDRVIGHYFTDRRRWFRLQESPYWIYHDIFYIFSAWDKVLGAARMDLSNAETNGFMRVGPIAQRTNRLHRRIASIIELREYIRIHQTSMEQFRRRANSVGQESALLDRLDDIVSLLQYCEVKSQTIKEQLHNLMNLEFNNGTVSQNQAISRLSVLAFIFIPLSFVASIFGITTSTLEPKLYPAVAIPILIGTLLVAWGSYQTRRDLSPRDKLAVTPVPPPSTPNRITISSPRPVSHGNARKGGRGGVSENLLDTLHLRRLRERERDSEVGVSETHIAPSTHKARTHISAQRSSMVTAEKRQSGASQSDVARRLKVMREQGSLDQSRPNDF